MDFSLVNIPNGLIEHADVTKIPFGVFPSLLGITKCCAVSYFIANLVVLVLKCCISLFILQL